MSTEFRPCTVTGGHGAIKTDDIVRARSVGWIALSAGRAGRSGEFSSSGGLGRKVSGKFEVRHGRARLAIFSPMKSMTGYGRGECSQKGFKITVEVSSVNRKQTEISVALPREMEMLEAQMRDLIHRYVSRGRLTVRVALHAGASNLSARMHLNIPLAKAYARELNRLSRQLNLPGPVTLEHLAGAPGVFQTDEQIVEEEDFWPAVQKALKVALQTLVKMRVRE